MQLLKSEKSESMSLLSPQAERSLVVNLMNTLDKQISEIAKNNYNKPPYIQQRELMEELGVNYAYLRKLEAQGLARIKIDSKDRTIFYKRSDVYDLMDKLKV